MYVRCTGKHADTSGYIHDQVLPWSATCITLAVVSLAFVLDVTFLIILSRVIAASA